MAHEHHHEEEEESPRGRILRIGAAALLLAAAVFIEHRTDWSTWQYLLLYLVPYLIVGWDTLREAAEALAHGEAMDENFLMSVATLGALAIGFLPGAATQFPEAVFVMLFFQVGELFEGIAEGRSRRSVAHLLDIRPDTANVERDGVLQTVPPQDVAVGETILIRPGEKVPMDGVVLEGNSSLDTVALTGESVPREVAPEDAILSGCVNLSGVLRVRTTRAFGESTASRILELVEHAAENKSHSEHFITRFARVYTPVVVALAVLLALVPPLLGCGAWSDWIYRALMFLVVSCPCALVISISPSSAASAGPPAGASSSRERRTWTPSPACTPSSSTRRARSPRASSRSRPCTRRCWTSGSCCTSLRTWSATPRTRWPRRSGTPIPTSRTTAAWRTSGRSPEWGSPPGSTDSRSPWATTA